VPEQTPPPARRGRRWRERGARRLIRLRGGRRARRGGCAGLARFDFFVTAAGPVLNEVNTTPGFTEQSQVPRMYAAVGLGYADLVRTVIEAALQRPV